MLWRIIRQCPTAVIGVETDSVFTTQDPHTLDISLGDQLGQWSYEQYDEMIYMQSGMYHTRKGEQWTGVKSRGITAREYPIALAEDYLRGLLPAEKWDPMVLETKPRFIGAGAALASNAPFRQNFCSWKSQTKEIGIGDTGKRIHNPKTCQACSHGYSPDETPHRLMIHSRSNGETLSFPRRLPWEQGQTAEVIQLRERLNQESELIETR
jgi:hypothetical protein